MCGLVGVARFNDSGFFGLQCSVFTQLLIADSVRGVDSTGLFTVNKKGKRKILKTPGNPFNLIQTQEYQKGLDAQVHPYIKIAAGHNRFATKGGVNVENAHPFTHGETTLMHNGTLTEYGLLPKKFGTDSEALCYSIEEQGIDKTIGNVRGAFALVYYDGKTKSLNFCRNYERPLFLSVNKNEQELMWASEIDMLKWVQERNKMGSGHIISDLTTSQLYSFDLNSGKLTTRPLPYPGSMIPSNVQYQQPNYGGGWEGYEDVLEEEAEKYFKKHNKNVIELRPETKKIIDDASSKSKIPSDNVQVIQFVQTKAPDSQSYVKGSNICFEPYDIQCLDSATQKFVLIGTRKDMADNIMFKLQVFGKDKVEKLVEEAWIATQIVNIVAITKGKKSDIIVWCSPDKCTPLATEPAKPDKPVVH